MGLLATGVKLQKTTGLVTVGAVRAISWSGISREAVETTAHDATSNWKTWIKGMKDGGEVTLGLNYILDNVTHGDTSGFLDDLTDDTIASTGYTISFYKADLTLGTHTFSAIVTNVDFTGNVGEVQQADVTFKIVGVPVFDVS